MLKTLKTSTLLSSPHSAMPVSMPPTGGASFRVNRCSSSPVRVTRLTHQLRPLLLPCNANGKILLSRLFNSSFSTGQPLRTSCTASQSALRMLTRAPSILPNARALCTRMLRPHLDGDNDTVEYIMALHDPEFNDRWIHSVTEMTAIGHNQLRSQVRASISNYVVFPHTRGSGSETHPVALTFRFPWLRRS